MTRVNKAQMGTQFHTGRQKSGAQMSDKFGAQMSSCNSGKKRKCPAPNATSVILIFHFMMYPCVP